MRQIDARLTYQIQDEALIITTRKATEANLRILLYPVRDLVDDSLNSGYEGLCELISSTVELDSWMDVGGPCSVDPFLPSGCLVVTQTQDGHAKVQELLAQLRAFKENRNASSQLDAIEDTYVIIQYSIRPEEAKQGKLVNEIMPLVQMIEPSTWKSDEVVVRAIGTNLYIRHRLSVHRRIVSLLQSLRLLTSAGGRTGVHF